MCIHIAMYVHCLPCVYSVYAWYADTENIALRASVCIAHILHSYVAGKISCSIQ